MENNDLEHKSENINSHEQLQEEHLQQENQGIAQTTVHSLENDYLELQKQYAYLLADLENVKRQTSRDRLRLRADAENDMIRKLLPLVDVFQKALQAHDDGSAHYKGLTLLHDEFQKILHEYGVTTMDTVGEFNPQFHEAVAYVPHSSVQPNYIIEVIMPGYLRSGTTILRYAKVVVAAPS